MTEWKTVSDGCGESEKEKKGKEKGPGRVFMLFEEHRERSPSSPVGTVGLVLSTRSSSVSSSSSVELLLKLEERLVSAVNVSASSSGTDSSVQKALYAFRTRTNTAQMATLMDELGGKVALEWRTTHRLQGIQC